VTALSRELARIRNGWRRGAAAAVCLAWLGYAALTLAALCWLDLLLAFTPAWRMALGVAAALALAGWLVLRLLRVLSFNARAAAVYADRALASRRREALSALELETAAAARSSPILAYLLDVSLRRAVERLREIRKPRPAARLRTARRRLLWCLAVALGPALVVPRAGSTLAARFLFPHRDIPPYSRYVFDVSPAQPRVVYGANQVISVTIAGAPVRQPVRFVTRRGRRTHEGACFQASPTQYAQRLERLMQPLEFCFRVGRARSRWHAVELLLRPHVEATRVRITPPAYADKPVHEPELGTEPLAGLRGSRVALTVRSNRPLRSGTLRITPTEGLQHTRLVQATQTGLNELTFDWRLLNNARLAVMIRDILGTAARKPLIIAQQRIPDEPPRVALAEPPPFSLATPSVRVPFYGTVEDDLGIRRADLLRSLVGYRDRARPVQVAPGAALCEVTGQLALAELGVEPGQVVELTVEAADTNPDLTGIGASDVARVQIISDAEYAEILRAQIAVGAFEKRFQTFAAQYHDMVRALQELADAVRSGALTEREAARRMQELRSRIEANAQAMEQLAQDFSAFDLERQLARAAAEMAEKLRQNLAHPGWQPGADLVQMRKAREQFLAMLGLDRSRIKRLAADAAEAAALGRVMECAAWYATLVDRQEMLVRRLERYAAGERDRLDPRAMGRNQDRIREELVALADQLTIRANALPDDYAALRESALAFVAALRRLEIPPTMNECSSACRNQNARAARTRGAEALEKMRELLSAGDGSFGGLCDGKMLFKVPTGDVGSTMSQMLAGLMQRYSQAVGAGRGIGAAGLGMAGAWDGSYYSGYSGLKIQVYGPQRQSPYDATSARGRGRGEGTGRGGDRRRPELVRERMRADERRTSGSGLPLATVPVRYRAAVAIFYGEQSSEGEAPEP